MGSEGTSPSCCLAEFHVDPETNSMELSSLIIVAQNDTGGGLISMLVMFGVIFLIFYFILIRPQKKEMERHQELLSGLKAGDQVVTAGGVFGTIKSVDGPVIQLEIGGGTKIKVDRDKIQKTQDEFFEEAEDGDDQDEDDEDED